MSEVKVIIGGGTKNSFLEIFVIYYIVSDIIYYIVYDIIYLYMIS